MRWLLLFFNYLFVHAIASAQQHDESININFSSFTSASFSTSIFTEELQQVLLDKKATSINIGETKQGRKIEAWYFPGRSSYNSLVIGAMHGSELSSIEVTRRLIEQLSKSDSIFYNVIIIPCLFPDNAATAMQHEKEIGNGNNIGRLSFYGSIDPNRQMPTPGYTLNNEEAIDHAGRKMEIEIKVLLQLINEYKPQRIASVHAIHNKQYAGFFADPRTDENSIALGYETDSLLALSMANYAEITGGNAPGNFYNKKPTALYYKDPLPVAKGSFQKRNVLGSITPGQKTGGISFGTWGATAVKDPMDAANNREAMRIITIEFPGNKRPQDYSSLKQKENCLKLVHRYAAAIQHVFLQNFFVEDHE